MVDKMDIKYYCKIMETKMIITDLDRSLLKNDKTISNYTIQVFNKCHEKGIIIAFATARPVRSTTKFIDLIKPNAVIFDNGALVMADKKIIYKNGINPGKTKEILKNIEKEYPEATLSTEIDNIMYTNFIPSDKTPYVKLDFDELPDLDAARITIGTIPTEKIKTLEKYISRDLYLEINYGIYGFILNRNTSKWLGIKELVKYYGIRIENTIAFGDDINDIEMIKNCGKGI